MEVDVKGTGRPREKQSNGVGRASVWEARKRIDQVKGGIKVFGLVGEEETEMGVVGDGDGNPLKRIGSRGGKRRTWKPQQEETFEGPIHLISQKSKFESTEKQMKGKFGFLQRAGEQFEVSENGSPGKVGLIQINKKVAAKSSNDRPGKKKLDFVGQFKIKPKVLERNDGGSDDDEEEEEEAFFDIKEVSVSEQRPGPSPVAEHLALHHLCCAKESSCGGKHVSRGQNILQSLLNLVMWRDITKSAIIFGSGTLIIKLCSSCMNDPNMCFISAISYLGLVCLAAIFVYRSIIWRGYLDLDDTSFNDLGEEELLGLTRSVLPYWNDLLRKLKAILFGDPSTTMKLAVLLFVLARFGSFITMWNVIELGFFTAFTIPKLWSLFCTQMTDQGKYWIQVSKNTRDLCPHNKAVAAVVIILVLGCSSNFDRIWAGFMLLVAFRYYRQSSVGNGCRKSKAHRPN